MPRTLACLAALIPFGAVGQTAPPKPPAAPTTELELIYLLVDGKTHTQMSGQNSMRVQISEGSADSGVTGTVEISKIGKCRYEVSRDLVVRISKDETLFYKEKARYNFSTAVAAQIDSVQGAEHVVTFAGAGTVSLVKDLYFVRKGIREENVQQSETEEGWELELKPGDGDVDAAGYIAGARDFASRFCPNFQPPRQ